MPNVAQSDNWSDSDNRRCVELVEQTLAAANLFGYGEIREPGYTSSLMGAFEKIDDPRFVAVVIHGKTDLYPALQRFFRPTALPMP